MTLPAAAAERRLHAYAANQLHAAAAVDRRDRQTDGRTLDRYIDRAYFAPYTAASMSGQASKYIMVHGKRNVRAFLKDIFDAQ